MASLAPPPPPQSPLIDAALTHSVASTAGTGGTASGGTSGALRRVPSRISSAGGSATLVPIEESLPRLDPFSDWQITPEEIEICKRPDGSDWELGSGGFGKVYKALRHGAQPVAVKVLAAVGEARYQSQEEAFVREIALLRACRDPNVVAFLGACIQPARTMLVTEYCDGGNLTRNLMAGRVAWYRRGKKIALDVARGLTYLHAKRIVHFDLKSPNVLLARDGTAKISDVGMAKIMAQGFSGITGNVGTLAWAAPEMLLGARCTEKADIYAYGVVLWEICTAQTPVRGQLRDVQVPEECPAEVRELILDCLATNPRNRPTAKEIVELLRALPDPPASITAGAAGSSQRSRLGGRRRSGALPPPGVAAGGEAGQLAAAGAAAAGQPATAAAGLAAAAPAGLPSGRVPPPRRSSESDSSLRSMEGTPGSPLYFASPQPLPTAYASPAPGDGLPLATQWLAAAGGGGSSNSSMALAGRRAGSMLPGALPAPPTTLQPPPVAAQRLKNASSSPPGSLPEPPPQLGPTAQRQASLAGAALRAPRPPRPAPSLPLSIARQASLDDPATQLAELQRTLLGPTGVAVAEQWQRRLQQAAQRPAAPLEQVPYQLRGSQLLPPLGQGEQSVMLGPQGQPQPQAPQAPRQQQQQLEEGAPPPSVPGQPAPGMGAPAAGPSLAAQLAKLQGRLQQQGSSPPPPSAAGQPPPPQPLQQQEQAGGQWGAAGEPAPVRLSPSLTSAGTTVRSSSDSAGELLAEVQQHEHAALSVQQHEEHAALLAAQHAAQRRMTAKHRSQQLQMVARHQHEMEHADEQQQQQQPQQQLVTPPHLEQGPAAGSPLQLQSGGPPPVSPFGLSE